MYINVTPRNHLFILIAFVLLVKNMLLINMINYYCNSLLQIVHINTYKKKNYFKVFKYTKKNYLVCCQESPRNFYIIFKDMEIWSVEKTTKYYAKYIYCF